MQMIEYRVRPVTRYIVTRFEVDKNSEVNARNNGSSQHGEFDNFEVGYEVAYALCKAEHDRLGWPPGDERIQYPRQEIRGPIGTGGWSESNAPTARFAGSCGSAANTPA
jgi:hypothetical protein